MTTCRLLLAVSKSEKEDLMGRVELLTRNRVQQIIINCKAIEIKISAFES
jgi:hypothetical protein